MNLQNDDLKSSGTDNDETLVLSFSRIQEFETCPKRYWFSKVLKLSVPSNPRMVYGKALHQAIEAYYLQISGEYVDGDLSKLGNAIEAFKRTFEIENYEGFHSKRHLERVFELGKQVIEEFHERNKFYSRKILAIEKKFKFNWNATIEFNGVMDLIEDHSDLTKNEKNFVIVDFKSNLLEDAKLRRIGKDNLQLSVYAWAFEKMHFFDLSEFIPPPIVKVAIESIETVRRYVETPLSTSFVEDKLFKIANSIRSEDFNAKPSFFACSICPFQTICEDSKLKM